MSARIIDTIIIGIISNILRLLFQNRLRIPHSDRHPLGTEHGTVIQSVAKNNDPVIGYIIPLHNFKMPLSLWTGSTSIVPFVSHTWGSVCRGISFTSLLAQAIKIL